jgi:hypothetical protein
MPTVKSRKTGKTSKTATKRLRQNNKAFDAAKKAAKREKRIKQTSKGSPQGAVSSTNFPEVAAGQVIRKHRGEVRMGTTNRDTTKRAARIGRAARKVVNRKKK